MPSADIFSEEDDRADESEKAQAEAMDEAMMRVVNMIIAVDWIGWFVRNALSSRFFARVLLGLILSRRHRWISPILTRLTRQPAETTSFAQFHRLGQSRECFSFLCLAR